MEKPKTVTGEILLQSVKNGDQETLSRFYKDGRAGFIKWSEKHFHCKEVEAVDVYQDAIITLYENIVRGKYVHQPGSSIKTYLYAIGKNIFLKKMSMEKKIQDKVIPNFSTQTEDETDEKEAEIAADEHRYNAVMQAFAAMKEPCKSILKYFYYQGLSMKQIADKMGYKSDQVVKSQKVRCLKTLKNDALKYLHP